MNKQQEQLALTILTKLAHCGLAENRGIRYCLFCGNMMQDFTQMKHSGDCIVELAKQLKETMQRSNNDEN